MGSNWRWMTPVVLLVLLAVSSVQAIKLSDFQLGEDAVESGDEPEKKKLMQKSSALIKVLKLLKDLKVQLVEEQKTDDENQATFKTQTEKSIKDTETLIEELKEKVNTLDAEYTGLKATKASKERDLQTATDNLVELQQKLKDMAKKHLGTIEGFDMDIGELTKGVEKLGLAVEAVKKMAKADEDKKDDDKEFFIQTQTHQLHVERAALKVKFALEAGATKYISPEVKNALDSFIATTEEHKSLREREMLGEERAKKAAQPVNDEETEETLSFVQTDSDSGDAAGLTQQLFAGDASLGQAVAMMQGKSGNIGALADTLEEMQAETAKELEAVEKAKKEAIESFMKISESIRKDITNKAEIVKSLRAQLTVVKGQLSTKKAALKAQKDLLQVTTDDLEALKMALKISIENHKARKASRIEEGKAITEALKILEGDEEFLQLSIKRVGKRHEKKTHTAANKAPPSFMQMEEQQEQPRSNSRATALLQALQTRLGVGTGNPFHKVSKMIRDMLSKLQEQQAEDMRRDVWCKSELAHTMKSKQDKENRIARLEVTIKADTAELEQVTADVENKEELVKDMKKALADAEKLRLEQKEAHKAAKLVYQEDQRVLGQAIVVLKGVYGDGMKGKESSGYQASSTGAGVVALLELSLQNFADLEKKADKDENEAQKDFLDYKSNTAVKIATFEKDLHYQKQTKAKLQTDLAKDKEDLESYTKELKSLKEYLVELEASCTIKGDTFEERQLKREQQLKSLKDALEILSTDDE
eukprot:TRINITY_DN7988_c0_g2_i1.p1 TRINITY_DN7988_c0_g2~~TRINITY_DN7988_c0_g2_i1.p1  ORF type:complete len:762 (+),score=248.99 TRINITY_DN7988_c0_g2_i1:145-2430(+)